MIRKKRGAIEWLEFELFANQTHLVHAVFLRHGGVSLDACTSLNAKTKRTGDSEANVAENRERMRSILALDHLIAIDAVHDNNVVIVDNVQDEVPNCDGIATNHINWGLLATHADCQVAIFYDPVHHAVANVHAGWRGQSKNIYRETVDKMGATYGTKAGDLLVAITPSLGPENSEFVNFRTELPQEFWSFQIKENYFDLWAIARYQLQNCGIKSDNIQIAEMDTFSNSKDFFSYRRARTGTKETVNITGVHGTVVALK